MGRGQVGTPGPPISPLFPYTTLFRSVAAVEDARGHVAPEPDDARVAEGSGGHWPAAGGDQLDGKRTSRNSRPPDISTLPLHDALPIGGGGGRRSRSRGARARRCPCRRGQRRSLAGRRGRPARWEEDKSELPAPRYLHSSPTRRSSDRWRRWKTLAVTWRPSPTMPVSPRAAAVTGRPPGSTS